MHKQIGGLDADAGDAGQQAHHAMRLGVGGPLQSPEALLFDAPDLVADEPPALHVSLELSQSVGRDRLALGRAQRLKPLLRTLQLRIKAADPQPDQSRGDDPIRRSRLPSASLRNSRIIGSLELGGLRVT